MKKALNVTLAALAMFALAACGSDDKAENGEDTTAVTAPVVEQPAVAETIDTTAGDAVEVMENGN
jgi:hypothetical protein